MEEKKNQEQNINSEQINKQENQQVTENDETHLKILELLKNQNIQFKLTEHIAVKTSQEAADIRGATLASGAKAMLVKDGKTGIFMLCVMSASRKLSWKLLKGVLNSKKASMANEQDVYNITKCIPGAVPPFGSIFKIQTYLDKSLIQQGDTINFNCGLRTKSIQMQTQDYLKVENPTLCEYTEE